MKNISWHISLQIPYVRKNVSRKDLKGGMGMETATEKTQPNAEGQKSFFAGDNAGVVHTGTSQMEANLKAQAANREMGR